MAKTSKCFLCNTEFGFFKWKHDCEECHKTFCSSCIVKFDNKKTYSWYLLDSPISKYSDSIIFDSYVCKSCWNKNVSVFDKKYKHALDNTNLVDSFSINYKGKVPIKSNSKILNLESGWHKDRDVSLDYLKVTALTNDCNLIYNLEYFKGTDSESTGHKNQGTYYYTVWKAVGTACEKK